MCVYICTSMYAHFCVWAQVCVHIHVSMSVYVCAQCTYAHGRSEDNLGFHSSGTFQLLWDGVSHRPGTSPSKLEELASNLSRHLCVSSSHLAVARIINVCHHIWLFTWVSGIWTQALKLGSKHFSNRVILPFLSLILLHFLERQDF